MITKVELHIYNLGTLPDVHWWLHLCKANRALKLIPNTANGDDDHHNDDDDDDDDDDIGNNAANQCTMPF